MLTSSGSLVAQVYFSPTDNGPSECKFRRHVCDADEYAAGCQPLQAITTFPRPSLTFQVLLGNDPRLATAAKYHLSQADTGRKEQLAAAYLAKGNELEAAVAMLDAVGANVAEAGRVGDAMAVNFWSERMLEKKADLVRIGNELRACDDAKRRHERELERLSGAGAAGGPVSVAAMRAIKQKEEKRNEEARKEAERFAKAWVALKASNVSEKKQQAVYSDKQAAGVSPPPAAVDEAQLAFDFETYLNNLDKPIEPAGARAPADAFPELESIMSPTTPGSTAAEGARSPSSSSALPDRLRGLVNDPSLSINGGSTTVATAVKHEIANVLEGFLVDLGSQFAEFEHGFRERHAARLPSVISGAFGQFQQGAARARSQSRSAPADPQQQQQQHMPGAFNVASEPETTDDTDKTPANPSTSTANYVHEFKLCDSCDKNPQGFCFKCDTCPDFDLCSSCLPRLKDAGFHDALHHFEPIAHPDLVKKLLVKDERKATAAPAPVKKPNVRHNAFCDVCSKVVRGVRYKCLDCPDWDACEGCYASLARTHAGHAFVRISEPADHLTARHAPKVLHPHISCDGCQKPVRGVRYKCVHPSCPDFDLCEACEAHPNHGGHPISHHMLKMRVPQIVENHSFFEAGAASPSIRAPGPRVPAFPRAHAPAAPYAVRSPPSMHAGPRSFPHGPSAPIPAHPKHPPHTLWGPPPMPRPAPWHPRHHMHGPVSCEMKHHTSAQAAMPPSYPAAVSAQRPQQVGEKQTQQSDEKQGSSQESDAKTAQSEKVAETAATNAALAEPAEEVNVTQSENESIENQGKAAVLSCKFEEDTTIPDGFALAPHSEVMKIWKMRNDGTSTIPADARLVFVDGERFATGDAKPIGHEVKPGETFYLSLMNVRVPDKVGETVVGRWELVDAQGQHFGDVLFIEISVVAPDERSGLESSSIIMPSNAGSPAAFASKVTSETGSATGTATAHTAINSSSSSFASVAAPSAVPASAPEAPVELADAEHIETRSAAPSYSTDNGLSESDFEDTFDELSKHSESDFDFISDDDF